jgi:hypothetical protein
MKVLRVWFRDGISIGRMSDTKSQIDNGDGWDITWDAKSRELSVVETDSGYSYVVPVENIKLMRKEDAKP